MLAATPAKPARRVDEPAIVLCSARLDLQGSPVEWPPGGVLGGRVTGAAGPFRLSQAACMLRQTVFRDRHRWVASSGGITPHDQKPHNTNPYKLDGACGINPPPPACKARFVLSGLIRT